LIERPITNPVIHPLSSLLLSDSLQVFHYDFIFITQSRNYLFADIVVNPSHKPFFSATALAKQSLSSTSAFGLELGTQMHELSLDLPYFWDFEKSIIRTDCKIIYAKVNAKNMVQAGDFCVDLFGKTKQEKASAFPIEHKQGFSDFPSEVFLVAIGNSEGNFDSTFDCGNGKNVAFDAGTSWEIVSHGTSIDNGFTLCFFEHAACLFNAGNGKLGWQTGLPKMLIDKWMQSDIVFDLPAPAFIDTELQTFCIDSDSAYYLISGFNPDFCSRFGLHLGGGEKRLFKLNEVNLAIPPHAYAWGLLAIKR